MVHALAVCISSYECNWEAWRALQKLLISKLLMCIHNLIIRHKTLRLYLRTIRFEAYQLVWSCMLTASQWNICNVHVKYSLKLTKISAIINLNTKYTPIKLIKAKSRNTNLKSNRNQVSTHSRWFCVSTMRLLCCQK